MIFNMILPQPEIKEVVMNKMSITTSSRTNTFVFNGIDHIPKFFVFFKEGTETTGTPDNTAWMIHHNNETKTCTVSSTNSSSTISFAWYDETVYNASIENGNLKIVVTTIPASTYSLYYTDDTINSKTVTASNRTGTGYLEFDGITQSDTSKFLLLVHTSDTIASATKLSNQPAYWLRAENNVIQRRAYSSSSSYDVAIRTATSSTEITEGYPATGLSFTRSNYMVAGEYTIYYA